MNFSELITTLIKHVDVDKPHAWRNKSGHIQESRQNGQTCKLHALQLAMQYTSKTFQERDLRDIPPVCAADDPDYQKTHAIKSLRQFAKKKQMSAVGEIPSVDMLIEIGKDFNYQVEAVSKFSLKEYTETLIELINENVTPCVYFDVNLSTKQGQPQVTRESKKNEHAAVAVGYFTCKQDGKLYFILQYWGAYFIVNAAVLSISAGSLSQAPRGPEIFYKFDEILISEEAKGLAPTKPAWFNLADRPLSEDIIQKIKATNPPERKTAKDREDEKGSFCSCILIVRPASPALEADDTLGIQINPLAPLARKRRLKP